MSPADNETEKPQTWALCCGLVDRIVNNSKDFKTESCVSVVLKVYDYPRQWISMNIALYDKTCCVSGIIQMGQGYSDDLVILLTAIRDCLPKRFIAYMLSQKMYCQCWSADRVFNGNSHLRMFSLMTKLRGRFLLRHCHIAWWRHNMKTPFAFPVMPIFAVFVVASLNNIQKKQPSCLWFATSPQSCD